MQEAIEPVHPLDDRIRGVSHVMWTDAPRGEGADEAEEKPAEKAPAKKKSTAKKAPAEQADDAEAAEQA